MKTQTAEEYFKENYKSSTVNVVKLMQGYNTTQIEALRERLVNDRLQLATVQEINSIINEFLKEINDEK